jgi:hypothetical protein
MVALLFVVVTIANAAYYSARMHQLNSIPSPGGSIGEEYVAATQVVKDRQQTFWLVEGVALAACLATFILARSRR